MDTIKKKALEALELHRGIVSIACRAIGLARSTFYLWKEEDDEFRKAIEEINEVSIDYVENKLFELIDGIWIESDNKVNMSVGPDGVEIEPTVYKQKPDTTAVIFYLKTKGKKRGYVEKSEVSLSNSEDQVFEIGGQTIKF